MEAGIQIGQCYKTEPFLLLCQLLICIIQYNLLHNGNYLEVDMSIPD